ncbi:MAG TPA: helix-turn-helix domain-containing protein [Ktedonobacteraceae bacterium]|jgi:DNA-binding MarR family transcriptional regulator
MESLSSILERNTVVIQDAALKSGFVQLPNFILTDKQLSAYAKLSYALLLSYAWQKDSCFPGQGRMANDLGVSERYLRQALKELEDHTYISVERRGLNKTNVYTILSIEKRWAKHKKKLGITK